MSVLLGLNHRLWDVEVWSLTLWDTWVLSQPLLNNSSLWGSFLFVIGKQKGSKSSVPSPFTSAPPSTSVTDLRVLSVISWWVQLSDTYSLRQSGSWDFLSAHVRLSVIFCRAQTKAIPKTSGPQQTNHFVGERLNHWHSLARWMPSFSATIECTLLQRSRWPTQHLVNWAWRGWDNNHLCLFFILPNSRLPIQTISYYPPSELSYKRLPIIGCFIFHIP